MSNARSERPRYTETDVPLSVLAKQLHLPVKTVLYLSSEGYIRLFVRPQQRDALFVSVHESLIAPQGVHLLPEVVALASKAPIGVTDLGADGMTGFFLSQDDCRELMHKGKLRQNLFPAAVKKYLNCLNPAPPNPGFFPIDSVPGLAPDGWRVASYPKETLFDLSGGSGYPPPISLDVTPNSLYVCRDDIDMLLDVLDSDKFLHDILVEEETDEKAVHESNVLKRRPEIHVIDEKPTYLSEKLRHLIATSERFWHTKTPVDPNDYEAKREKVRHALQDPEFHSHFDKSSPAKGVLEAASRFIEPIYARPKISDDKKKTWPWYLTPEIVTLMAASKLYWSSPHVELDNVATHPKNEEIEAYLRIRGISGNDANSAMTLIRPVNAARGRPVSEAYTRPRFMRKHTQ